METVGKVYARIANAVPEQVRDVARRRAEELEWLDIQLSRAKECIGEEEVVIPYDNGGGQTGIRSNPAFAEHKRLLDSWNSIASSLVSMLPDEKQEDEADKLADIRSKFRIVS